MGKQQEVREGGNSSVRMDMGGDIPAVVNVDEELAGKWRCTCGCLAAAGCG